MKSLDILHSVLADAHKATSANTSRDFVTIKSRHEHEGDSFFGITLSSFGSWIERSIELGQAETSIYSTFRKKSGGKSVLPCFLHGLTSLVFDPNSGKLRSDACVNAVFFIRQICYLFKKEKSLCNSERITKSISGFIELEDSIRKSLPVDPAVRGYLDRVSNILCSRLALAYSKTSSEVPRHGPGATADLLRYNAKFTARNFFLQWRNAFSWEEIYGYETVNLENAHVFDAVKPVKVIPVPKTMKIARIIAIEGTAMQFAQQYVSARFISAIKKIGVMSQLNLRDQTVNQQLALKGSTNNSWATLDLSEASDRLTAKLVHHIFRSSKLLRRHIFACRTPYANVNGRVLPLKKFASMGSALTFPVESFTFYIIAVTAVLRWFDTTGQHARFSFLHRFEKASQLVYVFGDDIVVPGDAARLAIQHLETCGLKVNEKKSFYKGPFRESCGTDAFRGYEITPVYIRTRIPLGIADANEFASFVSSANQMFLKGLWITSRTIQEYIDKIYKLPLVSKSSTVLGWETFQNVRTYSHFDRNGNALIRSLKLSSGKIRDHLDGSDALLKFFTSREVSEDPNHLRLSTKKYSIRLRQKSGIP